ncbi:MAG TPA: tetratricopeptide repeat protein [Gemmataceae bacterium]|nr:tetratricopeptide repeat protein [Gemmataceae bacterium]
MHEEHPSESGPSEGYFLNNYLGKGTIAAAVIAILFAVVVGFFVFLGGPTSPTTKSTSGPAQANESGVETARLGLSRQTDLNACRNALQQINAELGEKPALRPPAPSNEQKDWLRNNLRLSSEELSEVESNNYTRLDHHHLFRCLLLRDTAGALMVKGVRGKGAGRPAVHEKPLDRAVRAFAWVMREVRLRPEQVEAEPPSFVVRRGWGNALERALIFLALLEQLGDPDAPERELLGFLLLVPDSSGVPRLWACGVVEGGGKEAYLFDPYLGLPLPGPKGEGIATLAQAREQAETLSQLNIGKYRYPVTQEQARAAQAQLVCPLSALSPRMHYLQEKLLAPTVRVRLACAAAKDLERIETACSAGAAKGAPVQLSKDKCTLLRRFLPVDEGGADTTSREQRFQLALVPWKALPEVFQKEQLFPRKSALTIQVFALFANPFITPTMEADQPRDLLLRGRYTSAVEKLVGERDNWRSMLAQRADNTDLQEQFRRWLDDAIRAHADLLRAKSPQERQQAEQRVKKLWQGSASLPVHILLNSSVAAARNPEVAYQLGLCNQEQAEQLQARLDLQARAGLTPHRPDVENAESAWQKALENWKSFEEEYPTHPDIAAVLRLRGRAESMLGDHKAAIASWRNAAERSTSDLETIAALYLAQQWEKQHAGKDK